MIKSKKKKEPTICLIASHGGHLREIINATENISGNKYFVTYKTKHTANLLNDETDYFVIDPHDSLMKYGVNFFQSLRHVFKERPDIVISTGAGIAVPTLLMAKYLQTSIDRDKNCECIGATQALYQKEQRAASCCQNQFPGEHCVVYSGLHRSIPLCDMKSLKGYRLVLLLDEILPLQNVRGYLHQYKTRPLLMLLAICL